LANDTKIKTAKRILFFSLEDWNEIWRRNQFICAELCHRHPDLQILWVSPVVDISYAIRRGTVDDLKSIRVTPQPVPDYKQILSLKPFKLLPNVIGRKFNDRVYATIVRQTIERMGWNESGFITWINDHGACKALPMPGSRATIYDITDDWTKFARSEKERQINVALDAKALELADHVIVCSQQLFADKNGRCKKLSLIPNGVDCDRYDPATLAKLEPPEELRSLRKPIVGYTGTLHSERLDLNLLDAIAKQMPDVSFLFVGPIVVPPESIAKLKQRAHLVGPKPYSRLPEYIGTFDACMTPHLVDEFTESLDPLKLYEYMSTGKPIVSTPCAGFRDVEDMISIASTADDFCQAIKRELQEPNGERSRRRVEWARQHSWRSRVDEIERVLGWR
jgi:glycosyltransferase involved in cell wall biosynthesis